MTETLIAVGIMAALGLLFGVILAASSRLLRVEEDPRVDIVEQTLPGSNCGACGQAGCRAFAEQLVAGAQSPSRCTVSSPDIVDQIAQLLGVDAGESVKRVARLHCAGGAAEAKRLATYAGHPTCRDAAVASGGGKACPWGCLGLADCEVACTFDAIKMNGDDLPVVDPALCTACGDCVDACPRGLFTIEPLDHALVVQCSAPLTGEAATALCAVACDACGRCAQDAPGDLVRMVNGLPVVDYARGGPATPAIVARCPTGAIAWVPGRQLAHLEPDATPWRLDA